MIKSKNVFLLLSSRLVDEGLQGSMGVRRGCNGGCGGCNQSVGGGAGGRFQPKQTFHLDLQKDKSCIKKIGVLELQAVLFLSNTRNPIENIYEKLVGLTEERSWSLQFKRYTREKFNFN